MGLTNRARIVFLFMFSILALSIYGFYIGSEIGVRVGAGLILYSFMPGYLFLSLLFNDPASRMGNLELVALSIPISLALSTIISLIMSNIVTGLQPSTQILLLVIINGILIVPAIFRSKDAMELTAVPAMILMLLVFIFGAYFSTLSKSFEEEDKHTSLYILPGDNIVARSGVQLSTDEVFSVDIVIEDATGNPDTLTVMSNVFPDRIVETSNYPKSILDYEISFHDPGQYKLEWFLMDGEKRTRTVNIWLSVVEE